MKIKPVGKAVGVWSDWKSPNGWNKEDIPPSPGVYQLAVFKNGQRAKLYVPTTTDTHLLANEPRYQGVVYIGNPNVWISKRRSKKGVRYMVRWIEPTTGACRCKTHDRRQDAESHKVDLRRQLETGDYWRPRQVSFGEWAADHVRALRAPGSRVTPATATSHEESLNALARPAPDL